MHPGFAVHLYTAKRSLPCFVNIGTTANKQSTAKQMGQHGNEMNHGRDKQSYTVKQSGTAKTRKNARHRLYTAYRQVRPTTHGSGVTAGLCRAPHRQARQGFESPNNFCARNFPAIYFVNRGDNGQSVFAVYKTRGRYSLPCTRQDNTAKPIFFHYTRFLPTFSFSTYFISNVTHICVYSSLV